MARSRRFWLEWLEIFIFCFFLCAYFQFQSPFIPEADGYFHIKFAWLMRQHGLFRAGFPWAYFSLWRDNFSDGAFLFHALLIPFTFGDLATGAKLATVALSAFAFSSFFAILTLNRVHGRFYWFWLLLLGGGFFWWRMLVPRPQVLSVTLLLWSVHFLLNGRKRAFAALDFVYGLSYVAAFLPQVFSVIRWAYLKAARRRADGQIVAWGFGAYLLAMVVHPYFPKNWVFSYVQNVYVMFLAVTQKINLFLGSEFLPLDTRQLLGAHLPLILHLLVAACVFMHRRFPLAERTRVLFVISAFVAAMTCVSKRFVEYSVPLATLFCAFLWNDVFDGYDVRTFYRTYGTFGKILTAAWALAMLTASAVEAGVVRYSLRHVPAPRFETLAGVLARNVPPGEIVYTCDWDETPELLFYADQFRYPVIMDPTFMYYWDPEVWKKWSDVSAARLSPDETRDALLGTFHARYGLCGSKFWNFRRLIGFDPRFRVLDENASGFVFSVR